MSGHGLGSGLFAGVGAGLLALTSMLNPAFAHGADVGLIIGGSAIPVPPPSYVQPAFELYIQPRCPDCTAQGLFTPEGLYPIYTQPGPSGSAVKQLPFDTSVFQGRQILDSTIEQQVGDRNDVWIYGESQSSTISSLAMTDLAAAGVPRSDVTFVLVGDPDNPNGGLLARFPGLTLPSLGITFYGPTPDDLYPTTIYTQEYDGFADFPQYPINFLSDLNAFFGIYYVHPTYRNLTPTQISPPNAIILPTQGTTNTTYYMIPTQDLPLLDPLRMIPLVGNPLADLLQPDLKVLVNLGYGSITEGWSQGPANVETPFGVFPTSISPIAVIEALAAGAQQGVQAFIGDVSHLSASSLALPSLSSLTHLLTGLSAAPAAISPIDILDNIVNTFTAVIANGYATLLPTADIANAVLTTLPLYDVNLFLDGIKQHSLLNAVGLPVAADTGLLTLAASFEVIVILNQAAAIGGDIVGVGTGQTQASQVPASATAPKLAASTNNATSAPSTGGLKQVLRLSPNTDPGQTAASANGNTVSAASGSVKTVGERLFSAISTGVKNLTASVPGVKTKK